MANAQKVKKLKQTGVNTYLLTTMTFCVHKS